jgi:hypothetical protein
MARNLDGAGAAGVDAVESTMFGYPYLLDSFLTPLSGEDLLNPIWP